MPPPAPAWLLLITNLPGRNPALRMRVWRALKAAGAGLLRDGAYLLPNGERSREVLEEQGAEIKAAGGVVQMLSFDAESAEQNAELVALFVRTDDYAEAIRRLETLKSELVKLAEPEARQRLAAITREVVAIVTRDFFPGEPRKQMEGALADAESALNARFAPDEPHAAHRKIRPRDRKDYRGRTWATREHLWIDRVASAWRIRRLIDPQAKFLWLKRVKDCPRRALGFDFDGAEFTHLDSKVTFEVLVSSFNLEQDAGLVCLGALVHPLDVGGIPIPEAPGFATQPDGGGMSSDLKQRFADTAARQGLSESALLKHLTERALAGTDSEFAAVRPSAPIARDARITVRLVPEDRLLLRERAAARGCRPRHMSRRWSAHTCAGWHRSPTGSSRRCGQW